ncbi:MAG TPA: hypothetical protein DCF70_02720 [Treponema sp.]|nr:hypothetical protein [Treponema sp.]
MSPPLFNIGRRARFHKYSELKTGRYSRFLREICKNSKKKEKKSYTFPLFLNMESRYFPNGDASVIVNRASGCLEQLLFHVLQFNK